MAEPAAWIKQGATLPILSVAPLVAGVPFTTLPGGTTVKVRLKDKRQIDAGQSGLYLNVAGTWLVDSSSGSPVVKAQYAWQAADTATPGLYAVEVELDRPDGSVEIFPDDDNYVYLEITPKLQ